MKVVERKSPFIKQFSGPGDSGIVCFKFWQAVIASGCPGECAYCFLQTQTPYRSRRYDLKGTLFSNLEGLAAEAEEWLRSPFPAGLIVGENQDGLAFERPYKVLLGLTPLEILLPLFKSKNPTGHTLVVLSKFVSTEYAEALGPNPHTVLSWSLSLPSISRKYEKGVTPLAKRLSAARRLRQLGWRIRFRLDALAPVPDWEPELQRVIDQINEIEPEMLTVGALRATSLGGLRRAANTNGRDDSIFDYLNEKDPSGFKYRVDSEFHHKVFASILDRLSPNIRLGLCKEDITIWNQLGLRWHGCHCLHSVQDSIVIDRATRPDMSCLLAPSHSQKLIP